MKRDGLFFRKTHRRMRLCKLQSRDYFNMQKDAFLSNGRNMLYLTEIKLLRQSSSVIQCVYDDGKAHFLTQYQNTYILIRYVVLVR